MIIGASASIRKEWDTFVRRMMRKYDLNERRSLVERIMGIRK